MRVKVYRIGLIMGAWFPCDRQVVIITQRIATSVLY